MFHHVVLMEFTAEADRHFLDHVEAFAERVRRAAPNPLKYVFSRIASRSDGLTYGIVRRGSADAYQVSTHQQMKAYMTPYIAHRLEIDGRMARPRQLGRW